MPPIDLDYASKKEFDTGRFAAAWLRCLALLAIGWMVAGPFLTKSFVFDFSPIVYLWAASALKRHSRIARNWVVGACGLAMLLGSLALVDCLVAGPNAAHIGVLRFIQHPLAWQGTVFTVATLIVSTVPFTVLLTPTARRQFAVTPAGRSRE